jgi:tetratricopeptide (TPR) repeat protein
MRTLLGGLAVALAVASPVAAQDKLAEATRKAWEQFQKGRPEEAVKTMEKAAGQAPGGAGRLALSRFRARMGGEENLTAALAAAQQAVQESGSGAPALKSDALANLASLELRLANSKDALAHAEQALQAAGTPEAALVLARAQVRRGRSAQALATAEKAGASGGAAMSAKGFALLGLERPAEAADAFRKALEAEPARHRARIGLAAALLAQRKAAEAEAEARKAVDEKAGDAKDEEGFAVLGLAILASNPDDQPTWSRAIGEAQTGATVLNPKNPAVKYAVGKIFEHGDLAQAARNYQAALAVDPGFVQARAAMVQVLMWQKKPADAVALAKAGATEDPQSAEAQLLLGQVLLSTQAFAEALPALEAAVKLAPTHAEVHAALGSAYWRKGELDKAAAAYKRALELMPGDADLRLANAELLLGLKQAAAAAAEFKKVVEAPGYRDPIGWIKLGSAYRRMSPAKVDEAVAAYRKALELDPKNATAALGIGQTYFAGKRYDEAIRAFQEAAKLAPDVAADAHVAIAWCYVAKKDADNARKHLVAAGRIETELEQAIFRLARGDREVAAPAAETEGPSLAELTQQIQSKNVAVRQRGVRGLCRLGREAVDSLVWVVANEPTWDLRELAVTCLGNIGPAARAVVPYLRQILRMQPQAPTVGATDQQMKDDVSLGDLQRKAREALAKIQR